MKLKPFALSVATILLTSVTSYAGNGYLNEILRNHGYGYSDGYHAKRYCLPEHRACNSCSPVQPPMMQQPMMQQPMMQQAMMQQAMMPQPMMAPAYSPWIPPQFQPVTYPGGYPVPPKYQPWHPADAPGYFQPMTAPVANPNPGPVLSW